MVHRILGKAKKILGSFVSEREEFSMGDVSRAVGVDERHFRDSASVWDANLSPTDRGKLRRNGFVQTATFEGARGIYRPHVWVFSGDAESLKKKAGRK